MRSINAFIAARHEGTWSSYKKWIKIIKQLFHQTAETKTYYVCSISTPPMFPWAPTWHLSPLLRPLLLDLQSNQPEKRIKLDGGGNIVAAATSCTCSSQVIVPNHLCCVIPYPTYRRCYIASASVYMNRLDDFAYALSVRLSWNKNYAEQSWMEYGKRASKQAHYISYNCLFFAVLFFFFIVRVLLILFCYKNLHTAFMPAKCVKIHWRSTGTAAPQQCCAKCTAAP